VNQPFRSSNHEELFGPYRLEALLGRGGMGEVFRAFDTEYDRVVALKRLPARLTDDHEFRARFEREAQLAAGLRNPHIIPIHRFGDLDGCLFVDMHFVDGLDVADLIKAVGPVSPERAVAITEQAASALDAAHAGGLVHRGVKPSNLLIDRDVAESFDESPGGHVYVVDFAITHADAATRSYSLGQTEAFLGGFEYMAPEQFDGVIDKRVDIYALACVLFELVTGQKPFQAAGSGLPGWAHAHLHVAPTVPSQIRPELGTGLDEVIDRALAKKSEDRYESAGELVVAAREALAATGEPSTEAAVIGLDNLADEYADVAECAERKPIEQAAGLDVLEDGSSPDPSAATVQVAGLPRRPGDTSLEVPGALFVPAGDAEARSATDSLIEIGDDAENYEAPPAGTGVSGEEADPQPGRAEQQAAADDGREPKAGAAENVFEKGGAARPGQPGPAGSPASAAHRRVSRTRSSARWWLAVVAVIGVLAAGVGTVVTMSQDDPTDAAESATPPDPSEALPPELVAPSDATGPTVRRVVPVGQAPQGLAASPGGGPVLVANVGSRTVSVIDRDSATVAASMPMPGTPRYVTVSPDGRRAYVSMYSGEGADSAVAAIDIASGSVSALVPSSPEPYALAAAPTGDVYVPSHGSASVAILDAQTLEFGRSVTVEPNPHSVAFSPSGGRAYTANHESDSISVIDVASNTVVTTVDVGRSPHALATSPDGRLVAVANYDDGTISFVETVGNRTTMTVPVGPTPQHLTFSADGSRLYVVNEDTDALTTVDVATGAVVATTPVGRSPRFVVATSDGTLYVSNSVDGTVSVLDVS
jgi:YVTN family beta-propeller protein